MFTAFLVVALWKFDVVLDVLKTIGQIIFPFILGGAIVFVINVPMSFLEKKIFGRVKKEIRHRFPRFQRRKAPLRVPFFCRSFPQKSRMNAAISLSLF